MKLPTTTIEHCIARTAHLLTYLMSGRYYWRVGDLAADIGVSRQTLYAWKRGVTVPSRAHMDMLEALYEEVKREDEKIV